MGEQPKITTKKEGEDVEQNQENDLVEEKEGGDVKQTQENVPAKEEDKKGPETKGSNKPRLGKNCLSFTPEMRAAINKSKTPEALSKALESFGKETLGPEREKALEETKGVVKEVGENIKMIEKKLKDAERTKDNQAIINDLRTNFKDPFEGISRIKDEKVKKAITNMLLQNQAVKDYYILSIGDDQSLEAEKMLRDFAKDEQNRDFKENINAFLDAAEDARKNEEKKEAFLEKYTREAFEINEKFEGQINLSNFFDSNPDAKENLKKEIEDFILKKENYEIEEEEVEREVEGKEEKEIDIEEDIVDKEYPQIKKFFNKYLKNEKGHPFMKPEEGDNVLEEINDFLSTDENSGNTPTMALFSEFLTKEKERISAKGKAETPKEKESVDELPSVDVSKLMTTRLEEEKKGEKPPNWFDDVKNLLFLKSVDFGFSILASMIFSPVSTAIWLSKARLDIKTGKFDIKDWQDLKTGNIFEDPKKDKK